MRIPRYFTLSKKVLGGVPLPTGVGTADGKLEAQLEQRVRSRVRYKNLDGWVDQELPESVRQV